MSVCGFCNFYQSALHRFDKSNAVLNDCYIMTSELRAVLNALTDPIFLLKSDQSILLANDAAETLFGEGLAGLSFVRAVRHPDALACIDRVLAGAKEAEARVTLSRPVETMYRVCAKGLAPKHPHDPRMVVTMKDVSDIYDAEQMRSDFIANLSHELKSPLTALTGFIETIRGPARDDAAARDRFLDVMSREADRMNRLINDLLSLSKVEVKKRIKPSGVVDIINILEKVIHTLSAQQQFASKTIDLNILTKERTLLGEHDELVQVFHNLIENALKYSAADGAVRISIEAPVQRPAMRGAAMSIAIHDEGPGIKRAHIPRLTERFYRVDDARSRDKGGTGLGLAIVKHIVNRHRGRLRIRSEVGVGSTFEVILPLDSRDP